MNTVRQMSRERTLQVGHLDTCVATWNKHRTTRRRRDATRRATVQGMDILFPLEVMEGNDPLLCRRSNRSYNINILRSLIRKYFGKQPCWLLEVIVTD